MVSKGSDENSINLLQSEAGATLSDVVQAGPSRFPISSLELFNIFDAVSEKTFLCAHKHSLQALSVYVHDDHTVKINPLICAPLSAVFYGDCLHLFYPQCLTAKAKVLELFSVEHQLLSSHSGSLNLQFANDALLSVKAMFNIFFVDKPTAQQLAMFVSTQLPEPALWSATSAGY